MCAPEFQMRSSLFLPALLCAMPLLAGEPAKVEKPASPPPTPLPPVISPAAEAQRLLPMEGGRPKIIDPLPSLLPEGIPPALKAAPVPRILDPKKPASLFRPPETAADLDQRIRYRKARNVAEADAKVRAAWEESRDAKTDYAKRQALKRYYDTLFGKMLAIDRGIAPLVAQYREQKEASLEQVQIAPTVPLP